MTEDEQKLLAAQLRKPTGEVGLEVAHFMNKGNELLNRNTIQKLKLQPDAKVLEIGMGNGKFIPELFQMEESITYYGVDYSELMVAEATQINQGLVQNKKVQFFHNSADNLPFEDQSIDAIFTVNTIYFWEDATSVLEESKRVLKPGGQMVLGLRPKSQMKNYPFVKFGFNMFTPNAVVELFQHHGFAAVEANEIAEPDFVTDGISMPVRSLVVSAHL